MGFQRNFRAELERQFPGAAGQSVCHAVDARFARVRTDVAFARTSSNPIDRRLEFCAYFLATIQELESRGMAFEQIREICLAITESYVRPTSRWQAWLKRLPGRLAGTPFMAILARVMRAKAGKKGHPDGFLVRVVTGPAETFGVGYGFDILECGVCALFRRHAAEKYVPILCEVDRLTAALSGLELVRKGTIATGAGQCDFRFRILR